MYYPYFRGKQFELITLRENAERMERSQIAPIIEPVKQNISGLSRTLEALVERTVKFTLIANPQCGELCDYDPGYISEIVDESLSDYKNFVLGYIVNQETILQELINFCGNSLRPVAIIHAGYQKGKRLAEALKDIDSVKEHIFLEEYCSKLYRKHFRNGLKRVLIRDGFIKQHTNRDYPNAEHFSDLHITYEEENVDAFGDFLIVGDDFSDSGGPAYTVAIHLTYVDPEEDDDMFINHYLSDRTNTPLDPGGKFLEALNKLVQDVESDNSKILRSDAVEEYLSYHQSEHYPGLGYVKKLSMQHHIELMINVLSE